MRIKIELDENGNFAGYHKNAKADSARDPKREFIVETDLDPDFGGPNVVGLHCVDGRAIREKAPREIRRELKSKRTVRPALLPSITQPSRLENTPVALAAQSAMRLSELLLVAVLLAFSVGVAASSTVAYIIQPSMSPMILIWISIAATVLLLVVIASLIVKRTSYREVVPTGLPFNDSCSEILRPQISLSKESSVIPDSSFVDQAAIVLSRLRNIELKPQHDLLCMTIFLTILRSLKRKLDIPLGLSPYGEQINLGPNISYSDRAQLFYYAKTTSSMVSVDVDRRLLRHALPDVAYIHLPAGVSARLSLKESKLIMTAPGVEFTVSVGLGAGNRLDRGTAKRDLYLPCECFFWTQAVTFTLSFRAFGRRLWRSTAKSNWTFGEYLFWMTEIVRWANGHLNWVRSENK